MCCWLPVSIPCPNYKVVGFQHQTVDIPYLGYVHPSSNFSSTPESKMHASDKKMRTEDRQSEHGRPLVWASRYPNILGTKQSSY